MLVKKDTSRIYGIIIKRSDVTLDLDKIKSYIKATVYDFCNKNPGEWFSVRELFGSDWNGTPLQDLYEYRNSINPSNSSESAGKDAGNLLKRVLADDSNYYESAFSEKTHKYRKIN